MSSRIVLSILFVVAAVALFSLGSIAIADDGDHPVPRRDALAGLQTAFLCVSDPLCLADAIVPQGAGVAYPGR